MELLILANAFKIASARRIVAVLPCFPYSKQSKLKVGRLLHATSPPAGFHSVIWRTQTQRGAIPARLVADLMRVAGVTHMVTMELHSEQMRGFFDFPVDDLSPLPGMACASLLGLASSAHASAAQWWSTMCAITLRVI
jgi:ribose-phosphate pyrophosphokinase